LVFPGTDPVAAVEGAMAAEAAGWDGYFVWEAVWSADPWAILGAIAARTEHIRIGTMLTPLPIRRPWKLAGETATVDVLCGGRLILAVGLGAPETGFASFGLPVDRRTRAELLDEGLAVLTGLWAGQPFSFSGAHYEVAETSFAPALVPVQRRDGVPHIPIWVVGAWGREKSMRRVAAYDGMLPYVPTDGGGFLTPVEMPLIEMRSWLDEHAPSGRTIDLVVEGSTPGDDPEAAAAIVTPLAAAGATWWIESLWNAEAEAVQTRITQGPPAVG
jgi:alkanesulfonate monooxygenase SsuD/methylene tetrahydromethanopterin reductase-like flavin-dependent oxidoreductase (luciferase family)